MKVLFWGTPDFAAPALRALVGEGFDVVGVVTQTDKPQGRSRSTLVPSPIKRIATEEGLPVLQPERPRGDEFLAALGALGADISVVVAYGHILPQEVIALPRLGTLNIHASLLPQWRGAAPIQAAIRSGQRETGVTIMRMVYELDAGPIILQVPTPVVEDETSGELQLRLSELGALALVEALALIDMGKAREIEQDHARATFAPKVTRDDARVDWTGSAVEVSRCVRAYDPKPGAFTTLGGLEVKLFGARVAGAPREGSAEEPLPGVVMEITNGGALVACGVGAVRIVDAQPSGKRRLNVSEWARGRGVRVGDRFGT